MSTDFSVQFVVCCSAQWPSADRTVAIYSSLLWNNPPDRVANIRTLASLPLGSFCYENYFNILACPSFFFSLSCFPPSILRPFPPIVSPTHTKIRGGHRRKRSVNSMEIRSGVLLGNVRFHCAKTSDARAEPSSVPPMFAARKKYRILSITVRQIKSARIRCHCTAEWIVTGKL